MLLSPSHEDHDPTRSRLLEAAGVVFAEKGFAGTTVREICLKAGANVAAVNYHFRDKQGLYIEVLSQSMALAANEDRADELAVLPPEDALRRMIFGMLHRTNSCGERGTWHVRIMAHELSQPTAALDRVVQEVIRPRYETLRQIISSIIRLPSEHPTTRMCAHSVIGQVVHYAHARPVIDRLWPELNFNAEQIAGHIATLSLAGLQAIRNQSKPQDLI